MKLMEAFNKERERGKSIIYAAKASECKLCHQTDECRAGTCFDCKDFVETDMINVWEIKNPENKWPYMWIETEPRRYIQEEDLIKFNQLLNLANKGK